MLSYEKYAKMTMMDIETFENGGNCKKMKELFVSIDSLNIPKGNVGTPATKDWLKFKLHGIVEMFSDDEIESEGFYEEWKEYINTLV